MTAAVTDALGTLLTGRPVTYASDNLVVASVSPSGVINAQSVGTAHITVGVEGQTDVVTVTVAAAPVASVSVVPSSLALVTGATGQLAVITYDGTGNTLTGRTVTYATSNGSVATVSTSGMVTATGVGSATISATSEGRAATANITVSAPPVASVAVTTPLVTVTAGAHVPLISQTLDAIGNLLTGRTVVWASANTSVATVNASGVITGVAAGTTTVTGTVEGQTVSVTVTVTPVPVGSVSINQANANICVGQTTSLTATVRDGGGNVLTDRPVTWLSSQPLLASVSASGVVSGLLNGTTDITAQVEGQSATVHAAICLAPVSSITLSPIGGLSMLLGGTKQINATLRDAAGNILTGRTITWSVDHTLLGSISPSGLLAAISLGSIRVTATSEGVATSVSVSILF